MKIAPISEVLLSIDKPLQDEIVTKSGIKFFLDGSYNKNFTATVTGTVVAIPIKSTTGNLKIGDEVAFSYQTVSDMNFGSDNLRFMPCTEDNPHYKEFKNGKGENLRIYALPKRAGIEGLIWVGIYQDKWGGLIDGVQGTESEIERWQSKFQIGKTDIYTFNNLFEFEKKDYWKCEPSNIFAKKVKGHLIAVSNRIICIPIDEEIPNDALISQHKGHSVKIRYQDRARVLSSTNKRFKKDEIISFQPEKLERYEFWNKQYYLIREDLVLGKWNKN